MMEGKVHDPVNQRVQTPKPRSTTEVVAKRMMFWDWRDDSAIKSVLLLQKTKLTPTARQLTPLTTLVPGSLTSFSYPHVYFIHLHKHTQTHKHM